MTVHRLHAGDGYAYLTRQVASADNTRVAGEQLADYYTAQGAPAGRWHGRGSDALGVSGAVSEAQMKALFGEGLHPDADRIIDEQIATGASPTVAVRTARLGRAYIVTDVPPGPVGVELTARLAAFTAEHGRAATAVERVGLRKDAAAAVVTRTTGLPATETQIVEALAAAKRAQRHPVAGFDLVFTPQKSISLLWGLGDDQVRRAVESVHAQAVTDTLAWVQAEAGRTRRGAGGARQIDTEGLVVARFDHFDNRNGDPNLHTHAVVSNKVLGVDGTWSALDARVLYNLGVAASARYNHLMVDAVRRELGASFEARSTGRGTEPVWEVVGVDTGMVDAFSRRAEVNARTAELTAEYREAHGHSPSAAAGFKLTQQAILDTRQAKGAPRSLADMRAGWADRVTGLTGRADPQQWVRDLLTAHAQQRVSEAASVPGLDPAAVAADVVAVVSRRRSTWTEANLRSASEAALTGHVFTDQAHARAAVEEVVTAARDQVSLRLTVDANGPVPVSLARADGTSVYTVHGAARFTSERILDAEADLVTAAHTPVADGFVTGAAADKAIAASAKTAGGRALNDGQVAIARHLLTSGVAVAVAVGPAGAGKTTAMAAVVRAWVDDGRQVIALAPSAAAARVLGDDVDAPAQTVAKLLTTERHRDLDGQGSAINPGTMLLLDEAGMTATADLAALVSLAREQGAVVRMVGDPHQLAAVESGGALRLLARSTHAPHLTDVVRFSNPSEAAAGLAVRAGHTAKAWEFYKDYNRIIDGAAEDLHEQVLIAHTDDTAAGRTSLMLAGTIDDVDSLNDAAHTQAVLAGTIDPDSPAAGLHNGAEAQVGDTVVTRTNTTALRVQGGNRGGNPVTNGDLWRVRGVHPDGSLTLAGITHHGSVVLDPHYTRTSVELGYAATVHRAQGMTVDTCHLLADESLSRAGAYVGLTRGRHSNHLYLATDPEDPTDVGAGGAEVEGHHHPGGLEEEQPPADPMEVFARILARADDNLSATEVLTGELDQDDDTTVLRAMHHDLVTTLATDRAAYQLERAVPVAQHTDLTRSPRYRDLLATLAAAHLSGMDTGVLITAITDPRSSRGAGSSGVDPVELVDPLTGARDPAAVLTARVRTWIAAHTADDADSTGPGPVPATPPRHPRCDTDLADHTGHLADRITRLESAHETARTAGEPGRAQLMAQMRGDLTRTLPADELDRRLLAARQQLRQVQTGNTSNPAAARLRTLVETGEAERARRGALTPAQEQAEAEVRREMAPTTPAARRGPRRPVPGTPDPHQAHAGAQPSPQQEHDQGLGR